MRNFKIALIAAGVLVAVGVQAQKKVTYGKSTFTVYQPLSDLAPTPVCGFAPDVPGYTLKSKNYGSGTYYCYAPGNVPKTDYKCILTEIRDWVFYRPDEVAEYAAKKGLTLVDKKTIKKMFKDKSLSGSMYKLSDNSWIYFYVWELQNCGSVAWGSHEKYVAVVSYIEKVAPEPDVVLDKLYRFWNDGVRFADYAAVTQSNSNTRPTAPTDQNPNNFTIGDVLNREKGFYRLSFNGGAPTYVWHSYNKVVAENLKKSDFSATGEIGFNDLHSAIEYELNVEKIGKNVFFWYTVSPPLLRDLLPGRTWQKEMAERKENYANAQKELQKTQKANAKAFEMLYKEIFK